LILYCRFCLFFSFSVSFIIYSFDHRSWILCWSDVNRRRNDGYLNTHEYSRSLKRSPFYSNVSKMKLEEAIHNVTRTCSEAQHQKNLKKTLIYTYSTHFEFQYPGILPSHLPKCQPSRNPPIPSYNKTCNSSLRAAPPRDLRASNNLSPLIPARIILTGTLACRNWFSAMGMYEVER